MEKLNKYLGHFIQIKKAITKYIQVFKLSIEEVLVWKINFVLWRIRSIMQLLVLYFFWSAVFLEREEFFGYTQAGILTYILGTSLIRSLVLSTRAHEIAGEIHQGILTNYLLKPLSYLSYWFTRDLADKSLNIFFAISEIGILVWLLKPNLIIQENVSLVLSAAGVGFLALILFFMISFLLSIIGFWVREVWAPRFLAMIIIEFLAGAFFPLDILPRPIFSLLQVTPFPYLIFFPLQIYLGQISSNEITAGILILIGWMLLVFFAINYVWLKGLRVYEAEGR